VSLLGRGNGIINHQVQVERKSKKKKNNKKQKNIERIQVARVRVKNHDF
jgi:hypothetical protein